MSLGEKCVQYTLGSVVVLKCVHTLYTMLWAVVELKCVHTLYLYTMLWAVVVLKCVHTLYLCTMLWAVVELKCVHTLYLYTMLWAVVVLKCVHCALTGGCEDVVTSCGNQSVSLRPHQVTVTQSNTHQPPHLPLFIRSLTVNYSDIVTWS